MKSVIGLTAFNIPPFFVDLLSDDWCLFIDDGSHGTTEQSDNSSQLGDVEFATEQCSWGDSVCLAELEQMSQELVNCKGPPQSELELRSVSRPASVWTQTKVSIKARLSLNSNLGQYQGTPQSELKLRSVSRPASVWTQTKVSDKMKDISICTQTKVVPRRDALVVSMSTPHAVGCGFAPQQGDTKDHYKIGTNCPPA